jgi:hypothetical protein
MGLATLKQIGELADKYLDMTTASPPISAWAAHPMGKAARIAIAVGGLVTATLVLMTASVVATGSWALVVLGVGLAALSVRAARVPTPTRLTLVAASLIAIPLAFQVF